MDPATHATHATHASNKQACIQDVAQEIYQTHNEVLRSFMKSRMHGTGMTADAWLRMESKVNPSQFIKLSNMILELEGIK